MKDKLQFSTFKINRIASQTEPMHPNLKSLQGKFLREFFIKNFFYNFSSCCLSLFFAEAETN